MGDEGEEKAKVLYTEILGYNGTDCTNMEYEYIKEIIYRKIDERQESILKKDIINIMIDAFDSPSVVMKSKEYLHLVEDAIVPIVELEEVKDKEILNLLKKIAIEYKVQGNYQRALELCKIGAAQEQFQNEVEYKELLKESNSLELYLSLEKNFRTVQIDMTDKSLAEAIRDALGKYHLIDVEKGGGDIFVKGTGSGKENESTGSQANKMSAERKLEAIQCLLEEIKKEIPSAVVKEIKVNENGTFDGYIIIPIANTNITIFENMNDDINAALYLVDNEEIENIVGKLTKAQAKKSTGVESVNHTDDSKDDAKRYYNYKERQVKKAKVLLK